MARVKGGPVHARHRKRVLKRASGFVLGPGYQYREALEFTARADRYAYRDRRQKKRHFRQLWITRLSAACAYYQGVPAVRNDDSPQSKEMPPVHVRS